MLEEPLEVPESVNEVEVVGVMELIYSRDEGRGIICVEEDEMITRLIENENIRL